LLPLMMVTVREEFYIRLRRVARLGGFALARSVGDTDFAAVGSCVTRCWKLSFQRNVEIAVRA